MSDVWIVENQGSMIINLASLGVVLRKKGDVVDLVKATNKNVSELESNKDLKLQFAYNNLKTIKKESFIPSPVDNSGLEQKLDVLLSSLSEEKMESLLEKIFKKNVVQSTQYVEKSAENQDNKSIVDSDEDVRQEALMKLIFNKDKKVESNLENFGKKSQEIEVEDDFSDLID